VDLRVYEGIRAEYIVLVVSSKMVEIAIKKSVVGILEYGKTLASGLFITHIRQRRNVEVEMQSKLVIIRASALVASRKSRQ
jgi:hypothetical protein